MTAREKVIREGVPFALVDASLFFKMEVSFHPPRGAVGVCPPPNIAPVVKRRRLLAGEAETGGNESGRGLTADFFIR